MGRIPKRIREKALRKHKKQQEQQLNTQLNDLTISLNSNGESSNSISSSDSINYDLSLLHLPTVFYSPPSINSIQINNYRSIADDNMLTVSKYISDVNETTLVEYMYNFEIRYSKNILQIMKYLLPKLCQPFLIYELDFELMSFFRYLRWKMLGCYLKHTVQLRQWIQRMLGIIKLDVKYLIRY